MATGIKINIIGPSPEGNRSLSAASALGFTGRPTLEEIKLRLRQIRDFTATNNSSLLDALQKRFRQFENIHICLADTTRTALDYIKRTAGEIENITINRSSSVVHELKPGLTKLGFICIDSYLNEFKPFENKVQDYWQLASIKPEELFGSFDITTKMNIFPSSSAGQHKAKNYITLLGVNAASAEDGTLFFIQHLSNISKDLEQASKVILLIGLEKIVKNNEDAAFLTKCIGMFGSQSILMDLLPQENKYHIIESLPAFINPKDRELHIILLDNGRKALLEGHYRDLFLCIGCRACLKKCPINRSMRVERAVWSPVNYLKLFKNKEINSIDACLHCEGCRLQCPLDIDIPQLMWKAKREYLAKHSRKLTSMLLDNPEFLARVGTAFAPISSAMLNNITIRTIMEKTIGIHRKGRLPAFHHQTFRTCLRSQRENIIRQVSNRKIAYFHGCFANFYNPEIAKSSVSILQRIGVNLTVPEQKCCGLPMMANGNFRGAETNANSNIRALSKLVEQEYDVVTTCSSCSLAIKREYPSFFYSNKAKLVAEHTYTIEEYLMVLYHAGELNAAFAEMPMSIVYHSPCHMRAQLPAEGADKTLELLKLLPRLKISKITDTCCGMGGSYGLKTSSYEMSQEIGKHVFEEIRAAMPDKVVTDCGGCQLQIEAGTGLDTIHPMLLVEKSFRKKISPDSKITSLHTSRMC